MLMCSILGEEEEEENILERCGILCQAVHRTSFASHALDEHADGHSAREGMRINDNVRLDSTLAEGHVDGGPHLRADSFLPVSGGELVTNYRRTSDTEGDVDLL